MILALSFFSFVFAEQEMTDEMFWSDKYILILKSTKDYNEAVNFATKASEKLGLEFDNEDRKYSEEKGIYFSEVISEGISEGDYYQRRYSGEYISLENSKDYKGFAAGYIIVVAGIYNDKESASKTLKKIKEFHSDAYVKKAKMWMGCIQ